MTTASNPSPSSRRDLIVAPSLAAILVAALFAQGLVLNPDTQQSGWIVLACAALLMVLIAPRTVTTPQANAPDTLATLHHIRWAWLAAAFVAVLIVTGLNQMRWWPFLGLGLWLFALLSASIAVAGLRVTPALGIHPPPLTKREIMMVAMVLIVAALARFSWINDLPSYYFNDEPRVASFLINRLRPGSEPIEFFQMGWNTWSGLGLWLQGILVPILGSHIAVLRLSSAWMGTLAVLFTYLFTRELLSHRVALLAAILLAIGRTAIDFSRLGVCHAQVMAVGTFAFWCWWRGINSGSALSYLWAGIGLGLGLFTYNAGQLLPLLWGGWIVLCVLAVPRSLRTHGLGAALTLMGFLLTTFAWLFYVTDHFTFQRTWFEWTYMARNRQVLSHIVELWQAEGLGAALTPAWEQVSKTWLGFTVMPDNSYGIGYRAGGMLDRIASPLFVLGLALAAFSFRGRRLFLFYWWLPTTLLGGVLTESPPSSWRLVGIVPLLSIFAALPLDALLEASRRRRPLHAFACIAVMVVVAACGWDNWRSYFIEFGNSDAMLDLSSSLSHQIERTAPDTHVMLVGPEETFNLHSELFDVNFDARRLHDVADAASLLPIRTVADPPVLLVLTPQALRLIDQVRTLYPKAVVRDVIRQHGGDLMYRLVDLSSEQLRARTGLSVASERDAHIAVDPFAELPGELSGKALHWSGRVFWPSDKPASVQLRSNGIAAVRMGGEVEITADGSQPVSVSVQMRRGWQLFSIDEERAGNTRPTVSLRFNENEEEHALSRLDLRPDAGSDGLQVRYERDGTVLLDSRESQLNLCTREQVFHREDLAVSLPFAASWNGTLQVESSGGYEFEVRSTAPFAVHLDDSPLCQAHQVANVATTACFISRDLEAGPHRLSAWWDGSDPSHLAQNVMQLSWRRAGTEEFQLVPPEAFEP